MASTLLFNVDVAVIVAVPALTAVIVPPLTVATLLLEVDHVTDLEALEGTTLLTEIE